MGREGKKHSLIGGVAERMQDWVLETRVLFFMGFRPPLCFLGAGVEILNATGSSTKTVFTVKEVPQGRPRCRTHEAVPATSGA